MLAAVNNLSDRAINAFTLSGISEDRATITTLATVSQIAAVISCISNTSIVLQALITASWMAAASAIILLLVGHDVIVACQNIKNIMTNSVTRTALSTTRTLHEDLFQSLLIGQITKGTFATRCASYISECLKDLRLGEMH